MAASAQRDVLGVGGAGEPDPLGCSGLMDTDPLGQDRGASRAASASSAGCGPSRLRSIPLAFESAAERVGGDVRAGVPAGESPPSVPVR
jgi:hypothetical protein